jgi:hypothetical protein
VVKEPTASRTAIALLAIKGKSGRWDAPIPAPLAEELYNAIRANSVADSLTIPDSALRKAGCDMNKWAIAVEASQGGIWMKDVAGESGYVVPTHGAEGQYILSTLEQWKNPQWHAVHAEELNAIQGRGTR